MPINRPPHQHRRRRHQVEQPRAHPPHGRLLRPGTHKGQWRGEQADHEGEGEVEGREGGEEHAEEEEGEAVHEGVLLLGGMEVGGKKGGDEVGKESVEDGEEDKDGRVHLDFQNVLAMKLECLVSGVEYETYPFT